MAALAAAATKKAHQRKVTDFMVSSSPRGASGGAGELPSGPCGLTNPDRTDQAAPTAASTAAATSEDSSLMDGVKSILQQMRQMQEQHGQEQAAIRTLAGATSRGEPSKNPDPQEAEDDGDWQVWTSRKNRKVGETREAQAQESRQTRGETPFRLPGQNLSSNRGYYTSTVKRNQAAMDSRRSNQSSAAAALTEKQWFWFKKRLCLSCGMDHQVKDCPDVARRDEGMALLRAAFSCPPDMRPGGRGPGPRKGQGRDLPQGAARRPTTTPGMAAPAAAGAPPPSSAGQPTTATKRSRDQAEQGSSGLTPEAKKSRPFNDAVKASLTLFVREKDGTALSEQRYLSLKTSFAYYVEDMMSKNKDPPICSGRWTFNRSVVRIPMAGEMDLLWMRCFLDKAYLVQNEEEFNRSKGKIYVAYLRDRLEPEFTGMRSDKLANFVKYFKQQAGIGGLFDLKMAAKTPKGKAVHLVMDEEAEKVFVREGCKIPFAGAGWVTFEDRLEYVARIRSQERQRLRPKASNLEKGLREQAMDVDKMTMGEEEEEVVEIGRATANPNKATGAASSTMAAGAETPATATLTSSKGVSLEEAKEIAAALQEDVRDGKMEPGTAEALMLEKTGLSLSDMKLRRTASASSWSEEVEMAKSLSVPKTVSEETINVDDDNDRAQFELQQVQDVQDGHRAVGSAGRLAEGAAGSPSSL